MRTLPDYLAHGLDLVFVGLNPGLHSVEVGHYFATPRNRFWTALNASGLVGETLSANDDYRLLDYGIGLTDVVKRPTRGSADLRAADFRRWAPVLRRKLRQYEPRVVCFQGITAYRGYMKYAEGGDTRPALGLQPGSIGNSTVFVAPNPSPANAVWSLDDLIGWYHRLSQVLQAGTRR